LQRKAKVSMCDHEKPCWWEIQDRIEEIILANMYGYWDDRDWKAGISGEDKAAGYIVDYFKDIYYKNEN